jgi:hypothetical protein
LGNPARFTDPTGQDPVYCEFVTIGGEFAGGGCDYTGGSSDYLNPYQQYDYNCLVYPAGCGYYNGMPVPNYPAYGGGGYTPPSQPPPTMVPPRPQPSPPGKFSTYLLCILGQDINYFFGSDAAAAQTLGYWLAVSALAADANPLAIPVGAAALDYYSNGFLQSRAACSTYAYGRVQ